MATKTTKRVLAKRWCFTLNNYTPEEEARLKELDCEWMIFGHEHTEGDATPHLQGAFTFSGRRDLNRLKKILPRVHLEVMRGSPMESKFYCTKEDATGYFEKGVMPENGRSKGGEKNKQKWQDAYEAARTGKFELIPRDMWIRYQNSFKQVYFDNLSDASMEAFNDKDLKLHFLWLFGETGTGKSHTAHRIAKEIDPDNEPYLKDLNKWWNGYAHQRVTIIDEADPKHCEYLASYFKKWADKWAFTAECKGSVIPQCRPEYIIVTSNYSISQCFPNPEDTIPMERRFTEIHLNERGKHVYWPLTQPEWEAAQAEKENRHDCVVSPVVPGNTMPVQLAGQPPSPDSNLDTTMEEIEDTSEIGLIEPPTTLHRENACAFLALQGNVIE